jgi:hypothetical protein
MDERQIEKRPLRLVDPGAWRPLQPGLDLRWLTFTRQGRWLSAIRIAALRVDAAALALRVIELPPEQVGAQDIEKVARSTGALALMNASYFDPELKALGLLIVDGRQTSPLRREGSLHHGVFLVRGAQALLQQREEANPEGATQGFQAGPWLVADGAPQSHFRNPDSVSRRSAIGLDRQGRVVFAVADALAGGLSLPELAQWLAAPEPKGLSLWRAINCDGGASTQMVLRAGRASFVIRGSVHVPVYLAVVKAR